MTKKLCARRERELKLSKLTQEKQHTYQKKHTYAREQERERLRMRYTTKEHYFIIHDEERHIINFGEVYVGDGNIFPHSNGRKFKTTSPAKQSNTHAHWRWTMNNEQYEDNKKQQQQ